MYRYLEPYLTCLHKLKRCVFVSGQHLLIMRKNEEFTSEKLFRHVRNVGDKYLTLMFTEIQIHIENTHHPILKL